MAHTSRRRALPAALALLAVTAAPAAAKLSAESVPVLSTSLRAPAAVARTCSAKPLSATAPGAVVRTLAAPLGGLLEARLSGSPTGADWDLAVFDALNGRLLNGSAAFGGNEVVQAAVTPGQLVTVQACRRSGSAAPVALKVVTNVVSGVAPRAFPLQLVSIPFSKRAQVDRLAAAGLDLNETAHGHRIDAVLHRPADAAKIARAGMTFRVKVPDLVAYDRRFVRTSLDPISDLTPSNLPSGRSSYRHLVDYQNDLKALVEGNPGLIRPVILGTSVEGRTIEGIELAEDVARTDDGRPTHVEMGLHHVREWPSGETTIEYGFTLAKGYGKDPRITRILQDSRTFVMPVINPDGLEASMMAGDSIPVYDDNGFTSLPLAAIGAGPYRRKNCQPTQAGTEALPCAFKDGIDLNRNYGAFWGGPGSGEAPGPDDQTYRGPTPFSEPETQAVHRWSSAHQVMVINSNHTYAGDFLFQPGFNAVDEPGLKKGMKVPYTDAMKGLSDRMATAAGYKSFVSYNLYDVTGATEDWNYFAQGAFGYTAEIAWEDFHPNYQDGVVDQYLGTVDGVLAQAAGRTASKGLQESYLLAGEAAVDTANHAVIEGNAPAGATLTLTKDFTTATSYDADGKFQQLPEHLQSSLTVPASGHYVWHVNPSTRPVPLIAGETEAWTLSCGGEQHAVVVAIGGRATQDLDCT
ncbi:MAG: M14 family zinc carboxypeptidase [Solirubrobacteraceae bacterium]